MVETKYSRMAAGLGHLKQTGITIVLVVLSILAAGIAGGVWIALTGNEQLSIHATLLTSGSGFAAVAVGYLWYRGNGLEYIDVGRLEPRVLVLGFGLGIAVFSFQAILDGTASLAGIETGTDQIAAQATSSPAILLGAIVLNLFFVGPVEELFFRNVLQKRLSEKYVASVAILIVSLIFAPLHIGNFGGESILAQSISFTGVFVGSIAYGVAFAKWQRLEIVAIAHGINNSIVLLVVYFVL